MMHFTFKFWHLRGREGLNQNLVDQFDHNLTTSKHQTVMSHSRYNNYRLRCNQSQKPAQHLSCCCKWLCTFENFYDTWKKMSMSTTWILMQLQSLLYSLITLTFGAKKTCTTSEHITLMKIKIPYFIKNSNLSKYTH